MTQSIITRKGKNGYLAFFIQYIVIGACFHRLLDMSKL